MVDLVVEHISVNSGDNISLVADASFQLKPGQLTVLLGPNGSGKTSLVRAAVGVLPHSGGTIRLDGQNIRQLRPVDRGRKLAFIAQKPHIAWPGLVRDVVALGRFAYGGALHKLSPTDAAVVDSAIAACDLQHLAHRRVDTLSGGELARLHCARAFAVQAPIFVADEPIASLDPYHQFAILDLIKDFVAGGGAALLVLHDIGLAARYASNLLWMHKGQIVADGPPVETLTTERIRALYGVDTRIEGTEITILGRQ